jgi:hypothetical protein
MKHEFLKIVLGLLVLNGFISNSFGQEESNYRIVSSNLASSGSSQTITTPSGTYKISHSIGQASVIGTYFNNGYYLRQGYQQPLSKIEIIKELDVELVAKIHPNPFRHKVTIAFNTVIRDEISILLIDINGRVIRKQKALPFQEIELQLTDLAIGTYVLRVMSGTKRLDEKLIKI